MPSIVSVALGHPARLLLAAVTALGIASASPAAVVADAPMFMQNHAAEEVQVAQVSPVNAPADPGFHSLWMQWKQADQGGQIQQLSVAVPSQQPIEMQISMTSGFGVRSDPFRHSAAMHAGVDLAGKYGTPIYATADGTVDHAGWLGGYGNLVEIEHGGGIATRYGHLSAILVRDGQRVHRGDLIGRMGSTGRSTGNHLHYEVRIDGHAVNPIPYLQQASYLASMQQSFHDDVGQGEGGPFVAAR